MVSAADAERLRQAQAGIRVLVERDLDRFWSFVDLSRPERAATAFRAYLPLLVSRYGELAGEMAADWYDAARAAESAAGRFAARPVASPYADAVEGTARRLAGALFTDDPDLARSGAKAKASKYVLAAARATITRSVDRDPAARGWRRVTRFGACGFCRALAGRGAVYARESVHFASHGDCGCAAVPSWDPAAPEVDVRAYEASQRTSRMTPQQRARHNTRMREWMAEHGT